MTFGEAVVVLKGEMLVQGVGEKCRCGHVMASDLMSDVLLIDKDDMLLLTSLASEQVLRTAQIVGAAGVVVVNGKPLPSSMVEVARELGMALAVSQLSKYDACVAIYVAQGAK